MIVEMNKNTLPTASYQKWLDEKINEIKNKQHTPELLLHSCCAPCSSYVIEYLSPFFSITVFFYNPNIHPEEEYKKRLTEQISFIGKLPIKNRVKFKEGPYEPELFFQKVKGLEQEKEGGRRCLKCFELRMEKTAQVASQLGFTYFTTTLTVSPHKESSSINQMGGTIAPAYGIEYLFSDFKKRAGFQRSIELSHQYQLYRQDYCGCIFSRQQEKIMDRK
ncbi:MAG TPA: epoxyqueuosine reductase QueH [Atribacterota bacterium]|nr:epoxyqueuosine reductase QueH [Atribacterota bacterium]